MMAEKSARVGLVKEGDRRKNIVAALELVREDVVAKLRPRVLLKPNFLSKDNQLASSHVDAMRGVIDFLMSTPNPPTEITIAEGGNEDYSGQSFENFGYAVLRDEYNVPIELVDLNEETEWVETPVILADNSEETVKMPRRILDHPCTISVAIAKTHDCCLVTLALKNMIMGTIHKPDRIKMHGYLKHDDRTLPLEAQTINVNLTRLARFLSPDIAVIDGMVGLEGNGPGGTDDVPLGVAAAGVDVIATDSVMAKVMGFEPMELGLFYYMHDLGLGVADLAQVDVRGVKIADVARSFKPHETAELQAQWQREDAEKYLTVA